MEKSWRHTVRMWWGPVVTYLLASVLTLSQKQSTTAVIVLLVVCTVWTWLAVLTLEWWQSAKGWNKLWRSLAPLPVLIPLLWGAVVFFKPEIPPISYPWLQTNTWLLGENKEVKEIRLHITVRDEPTAPNAQKGVMTVSSLHGLRLRVFMPIVVDDTGWHSCEVGSVDAVEWNNHDAALKPIGLVELKNDTTVLEIRGSSRNASWYGTIAIHRKGNHVNWEKSLGGWVKTPQSRQALLVGEIRQDGVTTRTEGKTIDLTLTPELLRQYGIPRQTNGDVAKCPPMSSRTYTRVIP